MVGGGGGQAPRHSRAAPSLSRAWLLLLGRAEHCGAGRTAPPAEEYPRLRTDAGRRPDRAMGTSFPLFSFGFFFSKLISVLG